jgi:hypothetical protein
MQISPDAYHGILPGGGPLLTQVEPMGDSDAGLKKRSLRLWCRFRNQLTVPSTLKLVLRPTTGKPDIELPATTGVGNMVNTFGYRWVVRADLPANASGQYHVFLRVYVKGRAVGDGIGCDVKVP